MTFDVDRFRASLPDRLEVLDLSPGDHLRALAVAHERTNFADWETGENCRPAILTLARRCRMSERSVRKADGSLVAAGIEVQTGTHGRQRTPVFALVDVGDGRSGEPPLTERQTDDGRSGEPPVTDDGRSETPDGRSRTPDGRSGGPTTPTPTEGRGRGDSGTDSVGPSSDEVDDFVRNLAEASGLELDETSAALRRESSRLAAGGWTAADVVDRGLRDLPKSWNSPTGLAVSRLSKLPPKPPARKPLTIPEVSARLAALAVDDPELWSRLEHWTGARYAEPSELAADLAAGSEESDLADLVEILSNYSPPQIPNPTPGGHP